MRPRPRTPEARPCCPGKVSRVTNLGGSADASRDRASEMPLAVTSFTNCRREGRIIAAESIQVGQRGGAGPQGDQGRPLVGAKRHLRRQKRLYPVLGVF